MVPRRWFTAEGASALHPLMYRLHGSRQGEGGGGVCVCVWRISTMMHDDADVDIHKDPIAYQYLVCCESRAARYRARP